MLHSALAQTSHEVIATHSLSKRYGSTIALDGLDLTVHAGGYGFLSGSTAPAWLLNLTPFAHLGLAPVVPFRASPARC